MKYKIGETIKYVNKDYWFMKNHFGAVGKVMEHRRYGKKGTLSHYVVKWDCYTIPHIYTKYDIEACCEKVGISPEMDECVNDIMTTIDNVVVKPVTKIDANFAWKIYDFINKYKIGTFGEITLQQALDKHWEEKE